MSHLQLCFQLLKQIFRCLAAIAKRNHSVRDISDCILPFLQVVVRRRNSCYDFIDLAAPAFIVQVRKITASGFLCNIVEQTWALSHPVHLLSEILNDKAGISVPTKYRKKST